MRSFHEALAADRRRSEKGWRVSFQNVELGFYSDQVERYLNAFGRPKVLVILFEDLIRETAVVMQKVARFLDVDSVGYLESAFDKAENPFEASSGTFARAVLRCRPIRVWWKLWIPQKLCTAVRNRFLFTNGQKLRLDEEARRSLAERFAPDLRRLEQLLKRDFGTLRENG